MDHNEIKLLGTVKNIGELRTLGNGNQLIEVDLSTSYTRKDEDHEKTHDDQHKLIFKNANARAIDAKLLRGHRLFVVGNMRYSDCGAEVNVFKFSIESSVSSSK